MDRNEYKADKTPMTPTDTANCPHPKARRVIRIQRMRGKDVRIEICEQCGRELIHPDDAHRLLSDRASEGAPRWDVTQVLLALLGAVSRPIINRIVLMKEVFLLEKEEARELNININQLGFIPYDYGPYSKLVDDAIREMELEGLLLIEREAQGQKEIICLSEEGRHKADEILKTLEETKLERLRRKRKGWDQLGYSGILQKVYEEYPAYRTKSKIADKVLPTRRWT
jgi:uncharacterized protein YwgA